MRMNDTQLFGYVLYEISSIFFSTDYQNCALWVLLYLLELMSLPEENPPFIGMVHNRGFSVNRQGNSFPPFGVDTAFEQTINANAKSLLKDIITDEDVASAVTDGLLQTLWDIS